MKKIILLSFAFCSILASAQRAPWANDGEYFPAAKYLSGYAVNTGAETEAFVRTIKASAKAELIESIQVSVASVKEFYKSESRGVYGEDYTSLVSSFAEAEIAGLKTEYYYDRAARTGYAVAYVSRDEAKGYYKANISFVLQQIQSAIATAHRFESEGAKGRARRIYMETDTLFNKIHFAQSLLIAVENLETEEAQIARSLSLQSEIAQAISRLQTAIRVFVQSSESIFGRPVQLLAPKLKAELSKHGCSFTASPDEADLVLVIRASTRRGYVVESLYFSYLDVDVSLVERRTEKEIYRNNFTDLKGGALDYERAGRKAYDNGLELIARELAASMEK